jgi:SAM-dependent methyltransferase
MTQSFEQKYYDHPELWEQERFQGLQNQRALLTIQSLASDVKSVLDVGCGNGTVTNLLAQSRLAVGMDMSSSALKHLTAPALKADAGLIPFPDQSFDAVIATEVIEHIPYDKYDCVLKEMARISRKYILISVPYQEGIDLGQVVCPACGCAFNRNYHMRSYYLPDLKNLFVKQGSFSLLWSKPIVMDSALEMYWKIIARRYLKIFKKFQGFLICPQCHYSLTQTEAGKPQLDKFEGIKKFVEKMPWPMKRPYRWWVAFYQKSNTMVD